MKKSVKKVISMFTCIAVVGGMLLMGCGQTSVPDEIADSSEKKESSVEPEKNGEESALQKVTLNEVAHSIFYAPMYVAIEEGYFKDAGIDLDLVTGFGADKVMTAVLSGEADIGFMGPETTVYTANEGSKDPVINFAQLTQRAGNFLVAREEMSDFKWSDLISEDVLGGRAGGMPEMVFEYILKQNGIEPSEVNIDQSIDFGSTGAARMVQDLIDNHDCHVHMMVGGTPCNVTTIAASLKPYESVVSVRGGHAYFMKPVP